MLMRWRGIDLNAGLCWRFCQAMATQQRKVRISGGRTCPTKALPLNARLCWRFCQAMAIRDQKA
jgi:Pyruvate/2-oxoacid:ferredoxin oxidoreductase delta subunit